MQIVIFGANGSTVTYIPDHEPALAGAIAEYLSRQFALPCIPDRPFEPDRYLDRAWHVIR